MRAGTTIFRPRSSLVFSPGGCLAVCKLLAAFVALLLTVPLARAAGIEVRSADGPMALVVVEGDLELSDIATFREKVAPLAKATVAFRSDGGSLLAGIRIGMQIRVRNFNTVVADGGQCASACAVAWLGGARRFLGTGAKVGFHAAYVQKSGAATESGPGNAVLGAYLDQIGLPEDAIVYITQAAPTSMKWLSLEEAAQHGIDVALLPPPDTPAPASPSPQSLVAREEPPPQTGMAGRATSLVLSLAARWSEPNADTLRALDDVYADKVFYHGKLAPRQAVVAEKRRFAERWPQRRYKVRPHSVTASCNAATQMCRVQGVIERELANPATSAKSHDITNFDYGISASGPTLKIATETSTVSKLADPSDESSPLAAFVARLFSQVSKITSAPAEGQVRPGARVPR